MQCKNEAQPGRSARLNEACISILRYGPTPSRLLRSSPLPTVDAIDLEERPIMRLLMRNGSDTISFTKDLPDNELPKYAILSHTWGADEEEVTYNDMVRGGGKEKKGYEKIRFCIEQSKQDGLDYFWLDTCCIDKKNLVELDRSLRSMFRWYANAERCYVYMSGLPAKEELGTEWEREFRSHRWFRRGWTLQELIAPLNVEFFSRHGQSLGTKQSLEKQINQITQIPIAALRGQALADFSVVERKRWQGSRETREPEDLVYSMLGILNVAMPVLYGEGRAKAWERLESAITLASKGIKHNEFSLVFSLDGAAVQTQHFVARDDELKDIHKHLSSDGSRKVVVLHGLGGMGKTQLAMSYAERHREDYSALLWLNAKDETSARLSFAKMAKQILREYPDAPRLCVADMNDLDQIVNAVKSWLSMPLNTRWLLICDNYDNPQVPGNDDPAALDLRRYLPEAHQGSIIVTSRSAEVALGHRIQIRKFKTIQDGLQILEYSSGRNELANDEDAIRLAKRLDGLPLALATAGAYLSTSTITLDEYLGMFERSWAKLHKRQTALTTYEERTLYSTWQISYDQIKRRNRTSAQLLRLWAYFDNQDLWFELLEHLSSRSLEWVQDLIEDRIGFDDCMRVLCNHGLAEANTGNAYGLESMGYSVHACVHAWMTAVLNAEHDVNLAKMALECVASRVPHNKEKNWSLIQRRLLDHANRCLREASEYETEDPYLLWAYGTLALLYSDQGKLGEAEKMYLRTLEGYEKALGADHTSTLSTVDNLGGLYSDQDKLGEAEKMYLRALEGKEKALGADHTSTLDTVNNLGNLYRNQGKLGEAEKMYLRTLEGYEKALGADHTSTLSTVNNLGILYRDQGKFGEAEMMYLRALEGKEKALGADHTSTLDTVNNLGALYSDQGKLGEAEKMYLRALEGYEKALGADHTSTLDTVNNLGNLYSNQGKLGEAEKMYLRALEGKEKALGADHTSTLDTVNNLGNLYRNQGKLGEAEMMYLRALEGKEKALGADHTSTLDTVNNLGNLYSDQGKLGEAEKMYQQALEGKEKALGADHTSTLSTVNNLGLLYSDQGKLGEAEKMYLRALRGMEKALGADHTSTITAVICLSRLRINQRRVQEARVLYERAQGQYSNLNLSLQGCVDRLRRSLPDAETPAKKSKSILKALFKRRSRPLMDVQLDD